MNVFNAFVQKILDSGLEPDKAAVLISDFIQYRSIVKEEVQVEKNNADRIMERNAELWGRIRGLNEENSELQAKVCKLEAELSGTKSLTATVDLEALLDNATNLRDEYISFVKWVRSEGIVLSDGGKVELYVAKFVGDYVFTYLGYREMERYPFRGERVQTVDWETTNNELVKVITWLLEFNLPAYELVWKC